ncbi:MAG TPA: hypothetical protein VHV83_16450 [Armatimonadota bacterium]|nr:hypothetical protein [Armatimonadota bacterium]
MTRTAHLLSLFFLLLLLCTAAAYAQTEEAEYLGNFTIIKDILMTIIWSAIYIAIYAAALLIPLAYLRLFNGFETEMLWWIGATWAGGLVINGLVYAITSKPILAALIALPFIFGWSLLIGTRSFVDLLPRDAMRIAVVVAILCAPWFGPTWRIQRHRPPAPEESRVVAPQIATRIGMQPMLTWPVER